MTSKRRLVLLACGVGISSLSVISPARAANFTIVNGQTVTTQQNLTAPGEVGIVEPKGNIQSPSHGIGASTDHVTIDNAGTVSALGFGIYFQSYSTVTNSGSVTGPAAGLIGLSHNTVNNSGSVSAQQANGVGIELLQDHNTLLNSGSVNGAEFGIQVSGENSFVNNSGYIFGKQVGAYIGANITVVNSGTIESAPSWTAVSLYNNSTLINSGVISATRFGEAVAFGQNGRLILLAGSNIQGDIDFFGGSPTMSIGPGLNTALAFTSYGGSATIVNAGLPFVLNGGKVYALDVTGFPVQGGLANDLTQAVTGAVDSRLDQAAGGGTGPSTSIKGTVIHAVADKPERGGAWLSALGSYRSQAGNGSSTVGSNSALGGLVAGGDAMLSDNTRFGAFAGSALSGLSTEGGGQGLNTNTVLAGFYLGHGFGQSFIDASLTAGHSSFDSRRHIANNKVIGGIETASAVYGGWLISPSVKFGTHLKRASGTFTPSLRLRYTGQALDAYAETGPSAANLTVEARSTSVFDARAELAYAPTPHEDEHGLWSPVLRVGLDGMLASDSNISAVLVGQALNFAPAGSNALRGYGGFDLRYEMSPRAKFTLSAEAGLDTNTSFTGQASASFDWNF